MILAIVLNKKRSIFGRGYKLFLFLLVHALKPFRVLMTLRLHVFVNRCELPDLIRWSRNIELLGKKGYKLRVAITLKKEHYENMSQEYRQALNQLIDRVNQKKGSLCFCLNETEFLPFLFF